jgi:hypothetical protein
VAGANNDRCDLANESNSSKISWRSRHNNTYIRRISDDVINRRSLLRLGHQCLDILSARIRIDLLGDLDSFEAVADLVVDPEDALQIHVALDGRGNRLQLNLPILGDRSYTASQAAC